MKTDTLAHPKFEKILEYLIEGNTNDNHKGTLFSIIKKSKFWLLNEGNLFGLVYQFERDTLGMFGLLNEGNLFGLVWSTNRAGYTGYVWFINPGDSVSFQI